MRGGEVRGGVGRGGLGRRGVVRGGAVRGGAVRGWCERRRGLLSGQILDRRVNESVICCDSVCSCDEVKELLDLGGIGSDGVGRDGRR